MTKLPSWYRYRNSWQLHQHQGDEPVGSLVFYTFYNLPNVTIFKPLTTEKNKMSLQQAVLDSMPRNRKVYKKEKAKYWSRGTQDVNLTWENGCVHWKKTRWNTDFTVLHTKANQFCLLMLSEISGMIRSAVKTQCHDVLILDQRQKNTLSEVLIYHWDKDNCQPQKIKDHD